MYAWEESCHFPHGAAVAAAAGGVGVHVGVGVDGAGDHVDVGAGVDVGGSGSESEGGGECGQEIFSPPYPQGKAGPLAYFSFLPLVS